MKLTKNQEEMITVLAFIVPFGLTILLAYKSYQKIKDKPKFKQIKAYFIKEKIE